MTNLSKAFGDQDLQEIEARLRAKAAPIMKFLELAEQIDDGYPDRYTGVRNSTFNPDYYKPQFKESHGFAFGPSHADFSLLDGGEHGANLRISVWMRHFEFFPTNRDASMDIKLFQDGMVQYRGACHNLANPPPREPHPFAGDKYETYGTWRALSLIVDTYMYYSHEVGRVSQLAKLAADVFEEYYKDLVHENTFEKKPLIALEQK